MIPFWKCLLITRLGSNESLCMITLGSVIVEQEAYSTSCRSITLKFHISPEWCAMMAVGVHFAI
jgi:hypothetical protein